MKTKILLSAVAIATIFFACQNQQSQSESQDTMSMSLDTAQMMQSDTMTMENHTDMMASMNEMMNEMHKVQKTGNADHDLAISMKTHHSGAIDMAKTELASGKDNQLKAMAQKIMEEQSAEASDLQKLADKYKDAPKNYDPTNTETGLGKAFSDNMMSMMEKPAKMGSSTDQQFAAMMSKHHRDGIKMAKAIEQYAKDSMFRSMATKMIEDQNKEIKELETWMNNHGK